MARKIWARISMVLDVDEDVYQKLLEQSRKKNADYYTYSDVELSDQLASEFRSRGRIDQDSYIPASIFELQEERF